VIVPGNSEKVARGADLRPDDRAPGSRLRVGLTGLTVAEYSATRASRRALFIDTFSVFVHGLGVSALLGRMPSASATSPTSIPKS